MQLDELVTQFIKPVHRLASMIIGDVGTAQDVEEVTADALGRAWDRIGQFDPARTSLLNWVLMQTKYAALDRRRALLRARFQPDGTARVIPLEAAPEPASDWTPEDAALRSERTRRVHAALDRLPAEQRDLLIRRYFYEESIPDMAAAMNIGRAALDNRLWRARQALKSLLCDSEEVPANGQSAV